MPSKRKSKKHLAGTVYCCVAEMLLDRCTDKKFAMDVFSILYDKRRKKTKVKYWYEGRCTCPRKCAYHNECVGDPCASGINLCDNPKHVLLHDAFSNTEDGQ